MRVPSPCVAGGILAAVLIAFGPTAAVAADDATPAVGACHVPTPLQRRLVAKADEGMEPLRKFIDGRRAILHLDMKEVVDSLDGWRADIACVRQAEAARAAQAVAANASR